METTNKKDYKVPNFKCCNYCKHYNIGFFSRELHCSESAYKKEWYDYCYKFVCSPLRNQVGIEDSHYSIEYYIAHMMRERLNEEIEILKRQIFPFRNPTTITMV